MLIAKFTSFCNDSKNHAGNDYDVDVWTMRWTDVLAMDFLARTFWPWTFLSDKGTKWDVFATDVLDTDISAKDILAR